MKHSGRARQAALKLILWTLLLAIGVLATTFLATLLAAVTLPLLVFLVGSLWVLFMVFTFYFFRDPTPRVPPGPGLVVSPAHGKVDIIDEMTEPQFMQEPCRRVSVFLSVFDIHVQNAPVAGRVVYQRYTPGQFLNALKTESAARNENVMLGFSGSERGEKIGVKLISGVIARRIVPFVKEGDVLARGERISLIQFGSRTDLYLPLSATVKVKLGDRVVGGETVMATFEQP